MNEKSTQVVLDVDTLANSRKYSRVTDPEGRQETAKVAIEAHKKRNVTKQELRKRELQVKQIQQEQMDLAGRRNKLWQSIQEKQKSLEEFEVGLVGRLKKILFLDKLERRRLTALKAELDSLEAKLEALSQNHREQQNKIQELREILENLEDPQEIIDAYYERKSTEPLTNEQKRQLLKPEVLSQLSMEQYIALWRRLNPYFFTHVTRHGFREVRELDLFANFYAPPEPVWVDDNFRSFLSEKEIQTTLSILGLRSLDKKSVYNWLKNRGILDLSSASEAKASLFKQHADADYYPDKSAVHFARNSASHEKYGSERGNEVFIVYPTDFIASQYAFGFFDGGSFIKPAYEYILNDNFVWPGGVGRGISVDAGMVFLPKSTLVDPETGSKYTRDINSSGEVRPKLTDEFFLKLKRWLLHPEIDLLTILNRYMEERREVNKSFIKDDAVNYIRNRLTQESFPVDTIDQLSTAIWGSLIGEFHLSAHNRGNEDFSSFNLSEGHIEKIINEFGLQWERAARTDHAVPAQEYWENYFNQYPEQRPKHIVYYDGNPTAAVYEFLQKNGIGKADTSEVDGPLLGFDDNHVVDMKNDPRANVGKEEIERIAMEIIDEYYANGREQQ